MAINLKSKAFRLCVSATALATASTAANAHLVTFGWLDNGNGTVTLYGEHWHGDYTTPYSANGGITVSDPLNPSNFISAQWAGVLNNTDILALNLTGFAPDPGNQGQVCAGVGGNTGNCDDWFFTQPVVLGNGVWNFFTGTNCCIDTMTNPLTFAVTGIISVPPGTIGGVPEPSTWAMLLMGFGAAGFALRRKRYIQNKAVPKLA